MIELRPLLERLVLGCLFFVPRRRRLVLSLLAAAVSGEAHRTSSATEDVLAAHRPELWTDEYVIELGACTCGYVVEGPDEDLRWADFEAHQASALAAAGVLR